MKQSPEEFFREQERVSKLVAKFESKVFSDGTTSVWFDSEDIEDICNFYIEVGHPDKAEKAVALGERLHPTDELMPMLRAHILIEKEQPSEALQLLDKLSYTSDYYWHYLRFGALVDLQELDKATEEADAMLGFDNNSVSIAIDIGKVFADNEHYSLALQYLMRVDNNSDDEELLMTIAHCLALSEKYEDALVYVERMIDIDPYQLHVWQMKASLLVDMQELDKAEEAFEYALAISPDNETIIFSYSKLLLYNNKEKQAIQLLDEFAERVPQWKGMCMMLRADIHFYKGEYRKAHALYYKGFDKSMFLADSVMRYVECKAMLQKWNGVISLGNFLLQFTPDDLKLLEIVADAYACTKQFSMSAKMYKRCLNIEPDSVYLLLRYGSLMLDMQDTKKAYTAIHRAYKLMPEVAQTNLMMAVVCYMRKEYQRMYHYYRCACQIDKQMKKLFVQLCPDVKQFVTSLDSLARKCEKAGVEDVEEYLFSKK